jgi:hypothetical protein
MIFRLKYSPLNFRCGLLLTFGKHCGCHLQGEYVNLEDDNCSIHRKLATTMFTATLENSQHSTQLFFPKSKVVQFFGGLIYFDYSLLDGVVSSSHWYIGYDGVRLTSQNCGLYGPVFIFGWLQCGPWYNDIDWGWLLTRPPERSGSHQYCLAVLSAKTSLERVVEWAKVMRI